MLTRIKKARDDRDAGFTLIELLVVVIIIGILAAIAIPVFLNQRDSARAAASESDIRNAAIQLETYYTKNGDYPAAAADIAADITVSDGVAITYAVANGAYTLTACNTLASDPAATYALYDSDAGGIQAGATGTCPTALGFN
jgi:type IV pilus assembly protein PilA